MLYSYPFREPRAPAEYAAWAFADQAAAECRFEEPVVRGDRAAVDGCGVITTRDGSQEMVAGISLLRFDARGLVLEQREVWASAPGRHELEAWAPAT